jgi:drug/metabolite transporter (DMT)-like permease
MEAYDVKAGDEALLGNDAPVPKKKLSIVGILSIVGLVVTWIAQSEVAQSIQTGGYNKPYFITWCNHSWMALLVPVQCLWYSSRTLPRSAPEENLPSSWFAFIEETHGWSKWGLFKMAGWLSILYTISDYAWYVGLAHTSVSAGTCIFNSSCVFVYIFSVLLLKERVSPPRIFAVILACVGVAMVALAPSKNNATSGEQESTTDQIFGNIAVLLAAMGYGVYEVLFKISSKDIDDVAVINTITGSIGLFNIVVLWVGVPLVALLPGKYFGENFMMPDSHQTFFLVINGLLSFGFNFFLMVAVALTSPLMVSVACMLTIPLSVATDYFLWHDAFTLMELGGSLLVIGGFVVLTWAEQAGR